MAASAHHTRRWYPLHHFVALPLSFVLLLYTVRRYAAVAGTDSSLARLWLTLAALAFLGLVLVMLVRQHYALGLQDRIIRLEVRQRYFELTGTSLRALEPQLTLKQFTALRFAPDEQLPALAQAAAAEKLAPATIIERIGDGYQPDPLRV